MIIFDKNKRVDLSDDDFLASGGQANVYAKAQSVYKIYHEPSNLPKEKKLAELKGLPSSVVVPDNFLNDGLKNVGLKYRWIKNAIPIYNAGANGFWQDFNITPEKAKIIVEKLQETLGQIHLKGTLVVDLNPFNILLSEKNLKDSYWIDTEAYQTKSFKATAIMPSIRDYHAKQFTELTDWFSFAVITCEFFLGIHPFKGGRISKYDSIRDATERIIQRMKDNVSVFEKSVKLNKRVRSFDIIPSDYRLWYQSLFREGKRIRPPQSGGIAGVVTKTTIKTVLSKIELTLLQEYNQPVLSHDFLNEKRIIRTKDQWWLGKINYIAVMAIPIGDSQCLIFKDDNDFIFVSGAKKFRQRGQTITRYGNSFYVKNDSKIIEIKVDDLGGIVVFSVGKVFNVLPNATKLFNGIALSDVIGKPHIVDFENGFFHVPDLKGHRIIDAKKQNGKTAILTSQKYHNLLMVFNSSGSLIDKIETDDKEINWCCLERGVYLYIQGQSIFSSDGKNRMKIKDDNLPNIKLSAEENKVIGIIEHKVYHITIKK